MNVDRFEGLVVFLRVAESGSFAAAGKHLNLTRAAVSHSIKRLEKRLGVTLFTRTTRSLGLTEAGKKLLLRASPLVADLDNELSEVTELGTEASGTLKLTVPRIAIPMVLEPLLAELSRVAPRVQIEIVAQDGLTNIVEEGFDAGIRLGDQIDADCVAIDLTGPLKWQIVASPEYLEKNGTPQTPEDLLNHTCIGYRYSSSPEIYRWELLKDGRIARFSVKGTVVVNDYATKPVVARQGLGLAYDLASTFAVDVEKGLLIPVLEKHAQVSDGLFLYFPNRHQVSPKLRAFIDVCKTCAPKFRT